MRALTMYAAWQLDLAETHSDTALRAQSQARGDLLIPIVSIVYGAISAYQLVDAAHPGWSAGIASILGLHFSDQRQACFIWIVLFVVVATFLNLRGIKWTASANIILTIGMFAVIGVFAVEALAYLHHNGTPLLSMKPNAANTSSAPTSLSAKPAQVPPSSR